MGRKLLVVFFLLVIDIAAAKHHAAGVNFSIFLKSQSTTSREILNNKIKATHFYYGEKVSPIHFSENEKQQASIPEDRREKLWLRFKSPMGYHREILVTADSNATVNFDLGYDAPLIEENQEDMYWIIQEHSFVIQGVPDLNTERELKIGIKILRKGEFSIDLKEFRNIPAEKGIFLRDSLLQITHDLRQEAYFTESEPGFFPNRFSIVFEEPQDLQLQDNPKIEQNQEVIYLNRSRELLILNPDAVNINYINLHNLLGQQVHRFSALPLKNELRLPVRELNPGIYIVEIYAENGRWSKKVVLE